MMIRAALFLFIPVMSFGMDRQSALSMLETGNNDRVVGRAGEVSRYQVLQSEWRTVTNSTRYFDPKTATSVMQALIARRVQQFQAVHRREPTDFEFYVLWNAPAQAFRGRVSPVVAERAQRFSNLCGLSKRPPGTVAKSSDRPVNRPNTSGALLASTR